MTRHRFYCPVLQVGRMVLDAQESRHAVDVLRIRVGQCVELFDGRGCVAAGEIVEAGRSGCACEVSVVRSVDRPGGIELVLCTALPRAQRQQFLIEKCTELGVSRLVPVVYDRSVVKPKSSAVAKWRQWTIEAGKQCGSARLPVLDEPIAFRESLRLREGMTALYGATVGQSEPIASALERAGAGQPVVLWVGPEGGLADEEAQALVDVGAAPVSLGEHVLRIETACVAAAAIAMCRGPVSP